MGRVRLLWEELGYHPLTFGLPSGLLLAGIQHGLLSLQLGDGEAWERGPQIIPLLTLRIWLPFYHPSQYFSCPVPPGTSGPLWSCSSPQGLGSHQAADAQHPAQPAYLGQRGRGHAQGPSPHLALSHLSP